MYTTAKQPKLPLVDKNSSILTDFLIWMRDNDLKYKINDFHDRGYVLNDKNVNIKEILEAYNGGE